MSSTNKSFADKLEDSTGSSLPGKQNHNCEKAEEQHAIQQQVGMFGEGDGQGGTTEVPSSTNETSERPTTVAALTCSSTDGHGHVVPVFGDDGLLESSVGQGQLEFLGETEGTTSLHPPPFQDSSPSSLLRSAASPGQITPAPMPIMQLLEALPALLLIGQMMELVAPLFGTILQVITLARQMSRLIERVPVQSLEILDFPFGSDLILDVLTRPWFRDVVQMVCGEYVEIWLYGGQLAVHTGYRASTTRAVTFIVEFVRLLTGLSPHLSDFDSGVSSGPCRLDEYKASRRNGHDDDPPPPMA